MYDTYICKYVGDIFYCVNELHCVVWLTCLITENLFHDSFLEGESIVKRGMGPFSKLCLKKKLRISFERFMHIQCTPVVQGDGLQYWTH